jgi:microcystin degradation protein MlrC
MAKTLFAVSAAAFIVACVAGWAVIPTSQARVAPAETVQVDTFEMMKSAKQMPSERFADYSFVF